VFDPVSCIDKITVLMPPDRLTKISHIILINDPREALTSGGLDQEIVAPWPIRQYHGARSLPKSPRFSTHPR